MAKPRVFRPTPEQVAAAGVSGSLAEELSSLDFPVQVLPPWKSPSLFSVEMEKGRDLPLLGSSRFAHFPKGFRGDLVIGSSRETVLKFADPIYSLYCVHKGEVWSIDESTPGQWRRLFVNSSVALFLQSLELVGGQLKQNASRLNARLGHAILKKIQKLDPRAAENGSFWIGVFQGFDTLGP